MPVPRPPAVQHYQLFGLRVASEIVLPEVLVGDFDADPDLVIRRAQIHAPESSPGLALVDSDLVLTIPEVARYRVRAGREILVDIEPGTPDKNVRLYLLGSAMGAALHQRGLLPLHANAVEIEGRAVAFVGASGAGKSTLAAWFQDRGHRVLSDDVCVVHGIGERRPLIYPAVRRLRLCRDALIASGRSTTDFEPSYSGDPEFDKFDVPLRESAAAPSELSDVVLLEFGERSALERIEGIAAAEILFANTYRGGMVDQLGSAGLHWQAVTRLLPTIRTWRWIRKRSIEDIGGEMQSLIGALRLSSVD